MNPSRCAKIKTKTSFGNSPTLALCRLANENSSIQNNDWKRFVVFRIKIWRGSMFTKIGIKNQEQSTSKTIKLWPFFIKFYTVAIAISYYLYIFGQTFLDMIHVPKHVGKLFSKCYENINTQKSYFCWLKTLYLVNWSIRTSI